MEDWRDIPGYSGLYQINRQGEIISLNYRRTQKTKLMIPGIDKNGYNYICLCKEGKCRWFKVHRLVWETFVGPIPDDYEINHLNEVKYDNRLENLEVVTHKENINHGSCTERAGKKHRKQIVQYDMDNNIIKIWKSMTEVKQELGIDQSQISACCKGKNHYNTAGGFKWKYA